MQFSLMQIIDLFDPLSIWQVDRNKFIQIQ
jgi:hypothetical protein